MWMQSKDANRITLSFLRRYAKACFGSVRLPLIHLSFCIVRNSRNVTRTQNCLLLIFICKAHSRLLANGFVQLHMCIVHVACCQINQNDRQTVRPAPSTMGKSSVCVSCSVCLHFRKTFTLYDIEIFVFRIMQITFRSHYYLNDTHVRNSNDVQRRRWWRWQRHNSHTVTFLWQNCGTCTKRIIISQAFLHLFVFASYTWNAIVCGRCCRCSQIECRCLSSPFPGHNESRVYGSSVLRVPSTFTIERQLCAIFRCYVLLSFLFQTGRHSTRYTFSWRPEATAANIFFSYSSFFFSLFAYSLLVSVPLRPGIHEIHWLYVV